METPPYVVCISCTKKHDGTSFNGTGFIVDKVGHVVTCWHVVSQADEITVHLPYTEPWKYQVYKMFEAEDLVLLESIVPPASETYSASLHPDWRRDTNVSDEVTVWGYSLGKSGGSLLLSPPGTVRESFPSYGSSVFKPFLYQASVIFITDFVILDNSPLTLLSVSLSPTGVFEYLTFVSLFPFTQENTISKSASFQIRAKFEPLFNPLQIDIRFLLNPLPSLSLLLLTKFLPILREQIGLTKFYVMNNYGFFRGHL